MQAMMKMGKIVIADLDKAYAGSSMGCDEIISMLQRQASVLPILAFLTI